MGIFIGLLHSRAVIAAAELEVADVLAEGPKSVKEIAVATGTDAGNLFRLLRALDTIGVFQQVSPGVFANTPMGGCLRKASPASLWPMVRMWAPEWGYWEGNGALTKTVRTGKTALFETWGYDIWEHYRRNPEQWTVFNDAMRAMNTPATPAVTAALDWSRYPVIADIAGGIGSQLVDILETHAGCRGILFDQTEVLAEAIPHARVQTVAGSFFAEIPVEADAYILRNIIHDWDDEAAVTILKALRRAVKRGSRVMLVEWLIPDTPGFHFGKWTDLIMMQSVGGRERTRDEFAKIFSAAGFELEDVVPTASHFTIVIGQPV